MGGNGRRAPVPVRLLDARALRASIGAGRGPIGGALTGVTAVTDRGALWPVLGAALLPWSATRRAGAAGLAAVALDAAVVHGLKLVVRRRRPPLLLRLGARSGGRQPSTWSFPSGHTASACAFAAAAAWQQPWLALGLGPLAIAVPASRLTTGRHHPSDVVASMAVGAAAGMTVSATLGAVLRRRSRRSQAAVSQPASPASSA
ncbi:MAG: phosphatase PAP2 family protein [Frankiaceae bacterium]